LTGDLSMGVNAFLQQRSAFEIASWSDRSQAGRLRPLASVHRLRFPRQWDS